jgi:hypothetical protein
MNMKNIIRFNLIALVVMGFVACRKSDNSKLPDLDRVQMTVLTPDPASDAFINPVNPASFHTKFAVEVLFENDGPPKSADIVVMKNNNPANVKVVKADITSFPTTVEITGQQLITLFGPIGGGDQFDIGADVTLASGQKILAFPATGTAYSSGLVQVVGSVKPNSVLTLQYLTPCAFNADNYNGNFEILQDEWDDYDPGDVIQVTKVSATQFSFKYAVDAGSAQPIIVTVDPSNNNASVTKQLYGTYGGTPVHVQSVAGSSVNPCDASATLKLKHTSPSGATDYGTYTIRFRKQ